MGNKNFLKTNEKEQLLKYVPEIRKLFKDDLLEGKAALLEWSFAGCGTHSKIKADTLNRRIAAFKERSG